MNGDLFYQEFKDALKALGVSWDDQNNVVVSFSGQQLVFAFGGREYRVILPAYVAEVLQ